MTAPPEPQTQDLVTRLRDWVHRSTAECGVDAYDAADEIERLRAALTTIASMTSEAFGTVHVQTVLIQMIERSAELAREALAVSRPETTHADQS